jgi:hypothetical protein
VGVLAADLILAYVLNWFSSSAVHGSVLEK